MEPSELRALLEKRDMNAIALSVLHSIDDLGPVPMPPKPVVGAELAHVLETPQPVPEELQGQFAVYIMARDRRIDVREENARRQRTLLWAEKRLREHGYAEHTIIRDFLRDVWGME